MKKILLALITVFSLNAIIAQEKIDDSRIDSVLRVLNARQEQQDERLRAFKWSISQLNNAVKQNQKGIKTSEDSLIHEIQALQKLINSVEKELTGEINRAQQTSKEGIAKVESNLSQNTTYWIIGIAIALLLTLVLFFVLRLKVRKNKDITENEIETTRKKLEGESAALDQKLIEVLDKQMKIAEEASKQSQSEDDDNKHKLALKVADEIIRIQKNLSRMDEKVRGRKQLIAAVERIRDNFNAQGYEIVEMLNKPYHEGMKVQANFRPDENLEAGEQIITRIIKPQVNYNGVMIQSAQIEVSQGE